MALSVLPALYLGVSTMVMLVCLLMAGFALGVVGFYHLGRRR